MTTTIDSSTFLTNSKNYPKNNATPTSEKDYKNYTTNSTIATLNCQLSCCPYSTTQPGPSTCPTLIASPSPPRSVSPSKSSTKRSATKISTIPAPFTTPSHLAAIPKRKKALSSPKATSEPSGKPSAKKYHRTRHTSSAPLIASVPSSSSPATICGRNTWPCS
jgi:hypothetical protein